MEAVKKCCSNDGLRFTPVRRRVLEILLSTRSAMGAYDILNRLRDEGFGSQPPIVYRALDFLVCHQFAHKIESLNAFVACHYPGVSHSPAFFICKSCKSVNETPKHSISGELGSLADDANFSIECAIVEAEGLCKECQH
ncbi:MAG: transcriptional repressor [Aestuariivita sp.]|nr:transcriptional repressor [Aestuariivita sp.]